MILLPKVRISVRARVRQTAFSTGHPGHTGRTGCTEGSRSLVSLTSVEISSGPPCGPDPAYVDLGYLHANYSILGVSYLPSILGVDVDVDVEVEIRQGVLKD